MKKILKILFLFSLCFLLSSNFVSANNFIEKEINWYKFKVVKYDLKSSDFIFKVWVNPDWDATSLRKLMEENNWISAVNWVYFCPADYSECKWKDFTINERYVEWKKIAWYDDTWERVVFALDKNNIPFLFQTNKVNADKENEIYNWLWNFPLLLQDWKNMIERYWDVNLIDLKMKAKMQRNFVCSDKEKKYLYFWYTSAIEMNELPYNLALFWCYDAINLDAWKTSAMIYNSRYIIWPGRDLLDGIIIERKWLDTKELVSKLEKVREKIYKNLKTKPIWKQIKYLDDLSKKLVNTRSNIYELNSVDLFDENWKNIWYEINVNSLNNLKKLYIINYLDKVVYELKNKFIREDEERKSVEDPLF